MKSPWFAATMLAIESNGVIALRLIKLAQGGRASQDEAVLMCREKVCASFEAGATLMSGGTLASVVDRYREHVLSNSDRLLAH